MNGKSEWGKAPWHHVSWSRFLETTLPEMIAQWSTVRSYDVSSAGTTCKIELEIEGSDGPIAVVYSDIPALDRDGVFGVDGVRIVVPARAPDETFAEIKCVGEQLHAFIDQRVGTAPEFALRDEASVRAWFPLSELVMSFLEENGQVLDATNWLAVSTHLRRIFTASATDGGTILPGLACPFEVPEGPNLGRVVTVANGATIRDGHLIRIDPSAEVSGVSVLGPSASLIPFIERDDPARLLMGANMMRQWIPPINAESSVVQTGCEPADPGSWCGFSLLTAFVSLGRLTYEDGMVLSESAAERMQFHDPVRIGDKFSNRHGQKGVVSRILPDTEMPRLTDGTAVECVISFIGLHTRMNTGQLFEALYSWCVRAGVADPVVVPFGSPSREEIQRLVIDSTGSTLQQLVDPDGSAYERPSVAGYVYWGRTRHTVVSKLRVGGAVDPFQVQGEMEYWALRNSHAYAAIVEANGITAENSRVIGAAVKAMESGEPCRLQSYSAKLEALIEKLRYAGIEVSSSERGLSFSFAVGDTSDLLLPEPVAHPWISLRKIERVVANPDSPEWIELHRASDRLRSLLDSGAPTSLADSSRDALAARVKTYFSQLISHKDFVPRGPKRFGGRTVIVPGGSITVDQIGLPEEMCWVFFRHLVVAAVGESETNERSDSACKALSEAVAQRWVYINRAPTLAPTAILGFRPVMVDHKAIELHPMVCRWLGADFDGDQIAVYHPLTEEAQTDAATRLSVAGHLGRDPELVRTLAPTMESLWGIAHLSLSDAGREQITEIAGAVPNMPEGYITARALEDFSFELVQRVGADETVGILERLFNLGLSEAEGAGVSLNPFMVAPQSASRDEPSERDALAELFGASVDFGNNEAGPQLLTVKSGARGKIDNLVQLANGRLDGFSEAEAFDAAQRVRGQFARINAGLYDVGHVFQEGQWPSGYNVLSRAIRAQGDSVGTTAAYAAHFGEIDPLADVDAKLFAGILPEV